MLSCRNCVKHQAFGTLALNALGVWWSYLGLLVTPAVILQNILELLIPRSTRRLEMCLRILGMDPEALRINARGLSGEQQMLCDAAIAAIKGAIVSDSSIA